MIELLRYFPTYALHAAWETRNLYDVTVTTSDAMPVHIMGRGVACDLINQMRREYDDYHASLAALQMAGLGHFMKHGPVIIRPADDLARAMMDTAVNIPCREYHQPYSVIGVELPRWLAGPHYPCLAMSWQISQDAIFAWTFSQHNGLTYHMMAGVDLPTLEDRLIQAEGVETEDEYNLMVLGVRLLLNICILATIRKTDVTPLPPNVERHRHRHDDRLNQLAARHCQELRFLDLQVRARGPAGQGVSIPGGSLRSHERRGHWKAQPYGPRSTLRKRIFVNAYWTGVQPDEPGQTTVLS